MPLAGSRLTATPILMKACIAVTTAKPAACQLAQKGSRRIGGAQQRPHGQKTEQSRDDTAQTKPSNT